MGCVCVILMCAYAKQKQLKTWLMHVWLIQLSNNLITAGYIICMCILNIESLFIEGLNVCLFFFLYLEYTILCTTPFLQYICSPVLGSREKTIDGALRQRGSLQVLYVHLQAQRAAHIFIRILLWLTSHAILQIFSAKYLSFNHTGTYLYVPHRYI